MNQEAKSNCGPSNPAAAMAAEVARPVLKNPPWWFRLILGRSIKRTLLRSAALVSLTLLTVHFVARPIRVVGISMEPNFPDGTIHIIDQLAYLSHRPQRGDVVAYHIAGPLLLLKRVIGLPGERLAIRRGVVFVNGKPLAEPYLKLRPEPWNVPAVALGPDEYFLIGDNRSMNQENHTFGPRRGSRILGKLIF